jgi:6-phosphogluconolactonase/glucosamine-6-phosphate isomerase/deaminase
MADERVAPLGSPECALTYLNQEFLSSLPPPPDHMHLMLVDDPELATAARHSEMLLHVLGVGNAKELKTLPSRTGS